MVSFETRTEIDYGAALAGLTGLARVALPPGPPANPELAAQDAYRRFRALEERRRERRARLSRLVLVPALGAMALVLGATWYARRNPALTFTIDGGSVAEGGYVRTPATGDTNLSFSDGTQVRLAKQTRGRIASTSRKGARVMLDHGRAQVKVVPKKGASWVFDAGPCRVHVTGTAFDMRWSANEQVLEVSLYTGSVTVNGPPAPRGISMRAGQRLVMDVRQGTTQLNPLGPAIQPLAAPAKPAIESAPAEEPPSAASRQSVRPRRLETWSDRVLAGDFAGVLREARRRGVEDVLREGSPGDIVALADAARYDGEGKLARRALLAVRKRFAGSPQAHKAAFLLGRMAEDADGNLSVALLWYGRSIDDAPGGTFVAEALGRKMTATMRLNGRSSARPLAEEYLRRFPAGSYAEPARAILASP